MPDFLKSLVEGAKKHSPFNMTAVSNQSTPLDKSLFHTIDPTKWYKTFPYFFELRDLSKPGAAAPELRFFLPIPPSSMTIQQMSTADAIATLGGVVEETSQGVFSVITLTGTTGLSSSAPELNGVNDVLLNTKFRKELTELTNSGNVLSRLVNNALNIVPSILSGFTGKSEAPLTYAKYGSAVPTPSSKNIDKLAGAGAAAPESAGSRFLGILGTGTAPKSTVFSNGFSWNLALQQFFLMYQREKNKNPSLAMFFVDTKRNSQYRIVVRSASFATKADTPFITNYNLQLKAWDLKDPDGGSSVSQVDRFGPDGDLKEVMTGSITASITKLQNTMRSMKRIGPVAGTFARNTIGTGL